MASIIRVRVRVRVSVHKLKFSVNINFSCERVFVTNLVHNTGRILYIPVYSLEPSCSMVKHRRYCGSIYVDTSSPHNITKS